MMAFAQYGYSVEPVFSPGEIFALQTEITAYIDRVAGALSMPFEKSEPGADFAERLERVAQYDLSYANILRVAVCSDAHRGEAFRRIVEHRNLRKYAYALIGSGSEDYIMRLRVNVPSLSEHRQRWHSDVSITDGSECSKLKLTCWIPLMDAGPTTGGLEIAVGRQKEPLPHVKRDTSLEIEDDYLRGRTLTTPDCPMGSVVFLDPFTPHRAIPNHTNNARWSLVVWLKAPSDF